MIVIVYLKILEYQSVKDMNKGCWLCKHFKIVSEKKEICIKSYPIEYPIENANADRDCKVFKLKTFNTRT